MPKKTSQQKKTGARASSASDSAASARAYDEVDDRITIPVAPSPSPATTTTSATTGSTTTATASSAVLLSGIDKYRNLKGRSSSSSSLSAASASVDKASVHATFKSGMVAAVRSTSASASSSSSPSPSSSQSAAALAKEPPLERAQRLAEQKQYAAALPFFSEALKASSASAQTKLTLFFQRGTCALSARRYKLAVEDFTYVINLTPSNALLLARRAKAYAALHQHQNALKDYSDAILMTPPTQAELRTLLMARAAVSVQMGNFNAALDDLSQAETQTHGGDRDPALFYQRAQLRAKCQQPRLALEDLDKFMELQEDWTSSLASKAQATSGDGGEEGDDDACAPPEPEESDEGRRIVDVRMERAALLLQLAKEADDVRRKDAALMAAEQGEQQPLLGDMPRDYQTSVATSTPARRRHAQTKSDTSLTSALMTQSKKESKKTSYDTMGYRGADAIAFVERAVDDYSQILKADPAHSEALRLRGESLAKIGRPQDALRDFDAALELDDHDFHVQIARAKLLFALREVQQAIDEMTRVIQMNGFFVDALFLRAEMYEAIDEHEKAKADYTSIVNAELDTRSVGNPTGSGSDSVNLAAGSSATSKLDSKKGSTASSGNASGLGLGKITNEYSVQALLLRARLCQDLHDFDGAASDYKRIIESFPNHMEAQYELQENDEKREAFEKQRELDAVAWLVEEEKRREEELRAQGGSGSGSGAGAAVGGSAPGTGKAKKKKKTKKKKSGTGTTPTASETAEVEADATATGDEDEVVSGAKNGVDLSIERDQKDAESVRSMSLPRRIDTSEDPLRSDRRSSPTSAGRRRPISSPSNKVTPSELTKKSSFSSVSIVVTRDEACESMWEDHPDELELSMQLRKRGKSPLGTDYYPLSMHTDDDQHHTNLTLGKDDDALRIPHAAAVNSEDEEPDVEEPTPLETGSARVVRSEDDEVAQIQESESVDGESPTKASTPSHVAIRERLVDEKYLKKRQKQLDKLRVQLLEACEARDRAVIEETMARIERKQMSDSLEEELANASRVLKDMEAEAKRVEEEKQKQERYRQQELERERRRKQREEEEYRTKSKEEESTITVTGPKTIKTDGEAPSGLTNKNPSGPVETADVVSGDDKRGVEGGSKPATPSLVIRPIAYSHALHVAEQHQQQLLQYQRLVQEKDAEIAFLRGLVAQKSVSLSSISESDDDVFGTGAVAKLLRQGQHGGDVATGAVARRLDTLVEWMSPSAEADDVRFRILSFVRRVLERHWSSSMSMNMSMPPPLLFVATGSFPMKTYLPTADLDVTLFLPKELEPSWHFAVLNALCMAGSGGSDDGVGAGGIGGAGGLINGSPDGKTTASVASGSAGLSSHTVRNVTVINAEVRVVKCTIDNVSVDLTANRVGALGALLLLDAMDLRVGQGHLLKRSIVLIKSWCFYESSAYASAAASNASNGAQGSVLGASNGALTTYAINTIVMSLFNQHAATISHPLQALLLFLDRMTEFPWHESALTLFGAVPLGVLATSGSLAIALQKLQKGGRGRNQAGSTDKTTASEPVASMAVMTLDDVEQIRRHVHEQFGALDPSFTPAPAATVGAAASTPAGSASSTPVNAAAGVGGGGFKLPSFPIRACNVVDPLDDQNNLARSVSLDLFPSMKRAFMLGRNRLAKILSVSPVKEESIDEFFATCWKTYGRGDGWRPDLLVHPRQTWHARAPATNKDVYEHKWQSLLPEFLMAPSPLGPMGGYANEMHPYAQHPQHHHPTSSRHHHLPQYPHQHQHQAQHQQQHMGAMNGSAVNGSSPMNGHMHHYQQAQTHNSPGHYASHRSGSAGSNRGGASGGGYDDRVRASPTTSGHGYKSSPRRAQSLPGTSSATAQLAAAAAAVTASVPVNGNGYPVSSAGVYDYHPSTRSGGSSNKARRYDSPTTAKQTTQQSGK